MLVTTVVITVVDVVLTLTFISAFKIVGGFSFRLKVNSKAPFSTLTFDILILFEAFCLHQNLDFLMLTFKSECTSLKLQLYSLFLVFSVSLNVDVL